MRRTIFSCALLLGFAGACAVAGAGCSGDDTPIDQGDSSTPDAAKDTGVKDTSVPDTNVGPDSSDDAADTSTGDDAADTSTQPDTSTSDAGDASVPDTNVPDTNVPDTNVPDINVPDTNVPDTNVPDTNVPDTNVPDTSTPDTGVDAADAAPTGPTFDNPVQINVSAVLNVNTVVTTTQGSGVALTPMDGTGGGANTDFGTKSKMAQLSVNANGLPDNAFFGAVAGMYPATQLHWDNSVNQNNSRLVQNTESFSFDVPQNIYHQIVVYATSANGSTNINVTIGYTDGTDSGPKSFTVADWFNDPSADEFVLINQLNRITAGTTLDNRSHFEITGMNIGPDTTKTVNKVTIANANTGVYVFYGAVGY